MKQNKTSKRAVLTSALSLLLCCTMLIGTTWAWFTDSVTSAGNIIKSGTLDVEMTWADGTEDPNNTTWKDASVGAIFNNDLWEPGYVEVKHVKIANVGTLAFKYQIVIKANGELTKTADGKTLADAIDVYYLENATQVADRAALAAYTPECTLAQFLENNATANNTATGKLYPKDNTDSLPDNHTVTIALKMRESAGNEYQDMAIGTDFSVQLLATQWTYEEDTFDKNYDELADETPDNVGWPTSTSTVTITDPTQPTTISVGSGEGAATITIPANSADENDKFALTVTEVPVDPVTLPGETTYDVTFTKNGKEVENSDTVYTVELNIGLVALTGFEHNGVAMEEVDDIADLAENKYYYDGDTGIVTFMSKSFSPFTSKYLFAGGNGKQAHPYLLSNYDHLVNVALNIRNGATATVYYKLLSDISVAAKDEEIGGTHGYLSDDDRTYVIDLNGKTVTIGSFTLYGYASKMEVYNGTIDYTGKGGSFIGYACYQDVDTYNVNFHDLTLTGSIVDNGGSHYGPLVSYAFLLNSGSATFTARNIVNNMDIKSANSTGYVGGLFGYIQGSNVSAIVENCTMNGTIFAPYVGGFMNSCSNPQQGVTNTGNVLNGSLYGTIEVYAFSKKTGNGSVTLGDTAHIAVIPPSNDLFTVDETTKEVTINHTNNEVSYYVAAVMFMVNNDVNHTGGYPRYITKKLDNLDSNTLATGIYKYDILDADTDESANGTVVTEYTDTVIWQQDGTYYFWSPDYSLSNNKATLYVYGYDSTGAIKTYQTMPYTTH